jgi:NAD/NADP transhydrogenase beta subunit
VSIGSVAGVIMALRVKMTAMPEMVGLLNGFGGAASVLVAGSAMMAAFVAYSGGPTPSGGDLQMKIATVASGIIGSVTFFGSYVRWQARRVPVRQVEAQDLAEGHQVRGFGSDSGGRDLVRGCPLGLAEQGR